MIIKQTLKNGGYLSATTRKANHSDYYYGKYTIWPSELDYVKGNCKNVVEMTNLFLGLNPDTFKGIILESANNNMLGYRLVIECQ